MSPDKGPILDMLKAARLARRFAEDVDREAFMDDEEKQSAVLHQLLVLGEAAKRVDPSLVAQHDGIPWSDVAGMRDRLIHRYHDVDLEEVWRTVQRDLPGLIEGLEEIAPDVDG